MKKSRRYIVYGLTIDSEFPLATVTEVAETHSQPAIQLRRGTADFFAEKTRGLPPPTDDWIHYTALEDGSVYIKVKEVLQAVVSADGRIAVCDWLDGADRTAFEANFLNFVLSTSLTLQGEEPFHSTVLSLDGRAIGLLGLSEAGKSTLAACLIAHGADLITDDMLRLQLIDGVPVGHAGPYRLKLHHDSARQFLPEAARQGYFNTVTGKILVQPSQTMPNYDRPRPLSALFWLGDRSNQAEGGGVSSRRLGGIELARVLIASAMNIRYDAQERLERRLRFAEQVAKVLPVYALEYPRSFSVMDRVTEEIRRLASA